MLCTKALLHASRSMEWSRWSRQRSAHHPYVCLCACNYLICTPSRLMLPCNSVHAGRLLGKVVVDGFAGCGGNIVAMARSGAQRVVAIDTCQQRLEHTLHNARVYGVDARVETRCADFFQVAPELEVAPAFKSACMPPARAQLCLHPCNQAACAGTRQSIRLALSHARGSWWVCCAVMKSVQAGERFAAWHLLATCLVHEPDRGEALCCF